jgi:hypothetical protein
MAYWSIEAMREQRTSRFALDLVHQMYNSLPTPDAMPKFPQNLTKGTDEYNAIMNLATHFARQIIPTILWTGLFFTEKGYLGLGSMDAKPYDEVWALRGAYGPFLLRPMDDGTFAVVGEAYVHGVLHLLDEEGGDGFRTVELVW